MTIPFLSVLGIETLYRHSNINSIINSLTKAERNMTILLLRHVQPPPAAQANRRLAAKPSSGALAKNPRTTPHRRRLTVSEIAPTAPDREADTKLRWVFVSPLRVRRIFLLICGDARTMRS